MNIKHVYMRWSRAATLVAVVMMGAMNGLAQPYIPEEGSAELSRNSRAQRPAKVDPNLPNVLIIGDSISIGYTGAVSAKLVGKANVLHNPGNAEGTKLGLEKLKEWLGDTKWDVIHFNWGLHDMKSVKAETGENSNDPNDPRQADLETYTANLEILVKQLKATGAKLIFATTTPFPAGVKPFRLPEDAVRYNAAALSVIRANNIQVNDLYQLVLPKLNALQKRRNVHFNQEGSKVLGEQVADVIQAAIGEPQARASHPPAHSLFYKAQHQETGNMWDVWLYHHEGTYYLYYLANAGPRPAKGEPWNNISLATSPDGVHWTEKGPILKKAEEATWMGTGSTWKSPAFDQDGKFYMNFSEEIGGRQNIYFAESKDLLHWTRLEGEDYRFVQDERWYKKNGRWDCIWTLPKPGGGFYGYWTASPHSKDSKFGFGESDDGLHWKALPPPEVSGVNREHAEVGAVEKIGNKYYLLLGNYPPYMVTLVADRPEGPFRAAQKNFNILTGHTYFCRFFPHPTDGMLVCHFIRDRNGEVSFAPLKDVRIDGEGTLRLGWWKGNEKMKRVAIAVETPTDTPKTIAMLGQMFDASKGIILEGTLRLPKGKVEQRSGLYIECGNRGGAGVLIDHSGVAELGSIQANGDDFKISEVNKRGKKQDLKRVDREMTFASPARFRLLLKGPLMEFYLDDILIESFALPDNATGRIGVINSAETLGTLKAWE
jgi:acyl-CoA thioesterase-1